MPGRRRRRTRDRRGGLPRRTGCRGRAARASSGSCPGMALVHGVLSIVRSHGVPGPAGGSEPGETSPSLGQIGCAGYARINAASRPLNRSGASPAGRDGRTGAWDSVRNPARPRAKTAGALVHGVLFGFCRDDAQDLATAVPAREAVSFYPAGSLSKGRVKQRGLPAARSTAAARPMIGTALRTGAWGSVGSCACSTGMARPAGTRSGGPLPSLRQVGGANACESHRPGRPLDGRKPLAVQVHGVVSAICFCGDPWPPAHWCKGFCQQLVRRYVRGPSQEDHFLLCGR